MNLVYFEVKGGIGEVLDPIKGETAPLDGAVQTVLL